MAGETDDSKTLIVAGYAENQTAIDDAIKEAKKASKKSAKALAGREGKGRRGLLPVPTDFFQGAKTRSAGRFSFVSGSGFQSSEACSQYAGHEDARSRAAS